ncbi:hypothetical protein T484DRAFT_1743955 [Baffinella frigidus]|nr:hypothetical protein T484DRAFT_1743955 [Cryptophyta sp. CCMP2293]
MSRAPHHRGGGAAALLRAILVVQGVALGFVNVPAGGLRAAPAAHSAVAARRLSPALRPLTRRSPAILFATETATDELVGTGGKDAESAWTSAAVRLPRNAKPRRHARCSSVRIATSQTIRNRRVVGREATSRS